MRIIFDEVKSSVSEAATKARKTMAIPPATLPLNQLPICTVSNSGQIIVHHASVFVSGAEDLPSSPSLASFSTVSYSLASSRTKSTNYGLYARRMAISQETLESESEEDKNSFVTLTGVRHSLQVEWEDAL